MNFSSIRRTSRLLAVAATFLAAGAARAGEFPADWHWGTEEQRAKQDELLGKPAPALQLAEWRDGKAVTADDMKGKIVVVDFWATWCGPCIAAIPKNNEIAKDYADKGVIVVGVCGSKNGQEKMLDVAKEHGIAYPIAKDATSESAKAWRVMWWPTYGVIDRKGDLRALGLKPGNVKEVVEKLLKEGEPKKEVGAAERLERPVYLALAAEPVAVKPEWREGDAARRKDLDAMEGKEPPALKLKDWQNGKEVTLASLKGKVVVLDFWATWCGPCIASIPHTNELQAKHKDKGLVIIGVCNTQGADKMAETTKEKGLAYLTGADVDGATVAAFKADSFPDYYIIDRSGKLRIADCKNDAVDEAIELLLAEPDPSAAASAR